MNIYIYIYVCVCIHTRHFLTRVSLSLRHVPGFGTWPVPWVWPTPAPPWPGLRRQGLRASNLGNSWGFKTQKWGLNHQKIDILFYFFGWEWTGIMGVWDLKFIRKWMFYVFFWMGLDVFLFFFGWSGWLAKIREREMAYGTDGFKTQHQWGYNITVLNLLNIDISTHFVESWFPIFLQGFCE